RGQDEGSLAAQRQQGRPQGAEAGRPAAARQRGDCRSSRLGSNTMAIMGGKARWMPPQCTMDRIANMVNQLNAPVADTTGSPASMMSTCSGRSVDSGTAYCVLCRAGT